MNLVNFEGLFNMGIHKGQCLQLQSNARINGHKLSLFGWRLGRQMPTTQQILAPGVQNRTPRKLFTATNQTGPRVQPQASDFLCLGADVWLALECRWMSGSWVVWQAMNQRGQILSSEGSAASGPSSMHLWRAPLEYYCSSVCDRTTTDQFWETAL